jgi:oligoribonuclease
MTEISSPTPANPADPELLLWVDCEFTGLDLAAGHKIIEIGALVTDQALTEIEPYQSFVKYDWSRVQDLMDLNPWWTGRDADQARMKHGLGTAKPVEQVDAELAALTTEYFGDTKPPLCGNTIGNDKHQINDQMQLFAGRLSYQVIDVSSLKLVAQKYLGAEYRAKLHKHYAIDDIRESIDEFRFLLTRLGITDLSKLAVDNT